MRVLTDEEQNKLENKENYQALKADLLKEYKSYAQDLEFADDSFEEDQILSKREKLAQQIKALASTLQEIESFEQNA